MKMSLSPDRKGRITGSSVGAILGLSPWMTPDDVMRRMVREWHDAEPEFTGNAATEYGTFHEAGAIQDFEMLHGKTEPCGFFPHGDWLGATPDRLYGDDAVVEVKCPYSLRADTDPAFKAVSEQPHYFAQVQIEMFCADRARCLFYQWAPGGHSLSIVPRDDNWLADALPRLREFHERYMYEREHDYQQHLQPKRIVLRTLNAERLADEYVDLSAAIKRAEERRKEVLAELVEIAGARDAEVAGWKLTRVEKEGAISYASAIKALAPGADLSQWRGKPTVYWRLS